MNVLPASQTMITKMEFLVLVREFVRMTNGRDPAGASIVDEFFSVIYKLVERAAEYEAVIADLDQDINATLDQDINDTLDRMNESLTQTLPIDDNYPPIDDNYPPPM